MIYYESIYVPNIRKKGGSESLGTHTLPNRMRHYEYITRKEGCSESLGTHTLPNRIRYYEYITWKEGCSEYSEGGSSL